MMPVRNLSGRFGATLLFLLFSLDAVAQNAPQAVPQLPASPVSFLSLLQVLLGLVLVLAAVAGTAWLLKRLSPGQVGMGGAVRVVGGVAVGPKERLVLVEIGDTWLVVGVAPGQVNHVHNMPKPEGAAEGVGTPPLIEGGFASWLKQATQRHQRK